MHEARSEESELYGKEYDQGKVQHTTIYTFSRNRSDQFSSRKLSQEVDRIEVDLIIPLVTKFGPH